MKTFMEEYGLASVMAACVMFLVVMATPVGGAINGNLKSTATNMGDTGTNVQANAAKSIKSLAGEEEEVPDTIFVGYNSQNQCLVFSHDENSPGYSGCDTKYGDISELGDNAYSRWDKCRGDSTNQSNPWASVINPNFTDKILIENKIKPKSMFSWFRNLANVTVIDGIKNINTSKCVNMGDLFCGCKSLESLNLDGWNTSEVTDMSSMFASMSLCKSMNLSSFNTSSVKDTDCMFKFCTKLTYVNYGNNFTNSSLTRWTDMFLDTPEVLNKPEWYCEYNPVSETVWYSSIATYDYEINTSKYNILVSANFYTKDYASFIKLIREDGTVIELNPGKYDCIKIKNGDIIRYRPSSMPSYRGNWYVKFQFIEK